MIRRWFESLSRRDQLALLVLALAIGAWLFIQVVFVELDGGRKRLADSNQRLVEKLNRVDLKVEQLIVLRAGGNSGQINLTRTLNQASQANGLPVKRLQPNSRGEVQIRFEAVDFDGPAAVSSSKLRGPPVWRSSRHPLAVQGEPAALMQP